MSYISQTAFQKPQEICWTAQCERFRKSQIEELKRNYPRYQCCHLVKVIHLEPESVQ